MGSRTKKTKSQASSFAFCACLKPKSIYLTPNEKEAQFSCCEESFGQFASNLPPQQSKNSINGFKLQFSANSLRVNGLKNILRRLSGIK